MIRNTRFGLTTFTVSRVSKVTTFVRLFFIRIFFAVVDDSLDFKFRLGLNMVDFDGVDVD